MAISFVAAGTVATSATSSITVAPPAGVVNDDLLLLVIASNAVCTTPSGWTLINSQGSGQNLTIFYKFVLGTEASVSVAIPGATLCKGAMVSYRGAGGVEARPAYTTGTTSPMTPNTLTTTYADDYVISLYACASGGITTLTRNAATTARVSSNGATSAFGLLIADELQAAAGTSTARAATMSVSRAWSSLPVAIIPAGRTLYWVGGNGTWSDSATTNWADSSGGGGGKVAPSANDAAVIDSSSGSPTVTLSSGSCSSLTTTGATCTLATGALTVNGSATVSTTTTWSATGTLTITGTGTITTNGVSISAPIRINAPSETVTLGDALTTTNLLTFTAGSWVLNGFDATCLTLNSDSGFTRSISFGSNNVNITSTATTTVIDMATAAGLTFSGTGAFKLTGAASAVTRTITMGPTAGGALATSVNIQVSAGSDTIAIATGSWVGDLDFTGFTGTFAPPAALNIGGSLTAVSGMTWTTGTGTITFVATSTGKTITNAGKTLYNMSFTGLGGGWTLQDALTLNDFTLTGGALTLNNFIVSCNKFACTGTATRSIVFGTGSFTVRGSGAATFNVDSVTGFSYTGSGLFNFNATGSTPPVISTASNTTEATALNFNFSGTYLLLDLGSSKRIKNLSFTGFSGSVTISNGNSLFIYGSLTLVPGMTWPNSTHIINFVSTTTGNTITTAGRTGTFNNITFAGIGGGWVFQDALATISIFTVTNGTVNSNGFNLSATSYTLTGGAITMGSSTWTATGTDTVWSRTGTTITPDTSTIAFSSTGSTGLTFAGGGATYNNLSLSSAAGTGTLTITGANTFNTLSSSRTGNYTVSLPAGATTTVTTWSIVGTNKTTNAVTINSTTAGTQATLSVASGTVSPNFAFIQDSNATGGATFVVTNALNLGNTTGWFGSNQQGLYWVGGAGTWNTSSATNWSNISGGTGGYLVPSAITDVFFDGNSGTGTVAGSGAPLAKSINFTGFTGAFSPATIQAYGSLTLASTMTLNSGGTFILNSTGSVTVTTAGKIVNSAIIMQGGGTYTLQDALVMGSVPNTWSTLSLSAGTLILNGFDVNCGSFQSATSSVRSINFGSNLIYVRSQSTAANLSIPNVTSFTFTGSGGFRLYSGFSGGTNTITVGTTAGSATTVPNVSLSTDSNSNIVAITTGSSFKNLDFSTYNQAFTAPAALNIYGSLTLSSASSWTTGTGTITFGATSTGNTITTAGKTLYGVTFAGVGGGWTIQDNLTLSQYFTLTNGTFDANNLNVTADAVNISGSAARTLTMGSGTWTLTNTGAVQLWNAGTTTNLTFNRNTSTIVLSSTATTAKTFVGGGLTYYNLQIGGATGTATYTFTGSNTFNNISDTKTVAYTITLTAGTTTTVSSFTATGISGALLTLNSATSGTQATLASSGSVISGINYLTIQDINFTPTPSGTQKYLWYVGANSTFGTNVTGGALLTSDTTKIAYQLTSGTSWAVPSDWNSASNDVYLIGGGAGGGGSVVVTATGVHVSGAGGGGGGFTTATNLSLTPSSSVTYAIGAAGTAGVGSASTANSGSGGTTSFNSGAYSAGGGGGATVSTTVSTPGTAGTGSTFNGGAGGAGTVAGNVSNAGGGGGGSGGIDAAGAAGGANSSTTPGTGGAGDNNVNQNLGISTIPYGDGALGGGAGALGVAGTIYGGAGSGGGNASGSSTRRNGGVGTQGIIFILYTSSPPPSTNSGNFLNFFYQ